MPFQSFWNFCKNHQKSPFGLGKLNWSCQNHGNLGSVNDSNGHWNFNGQFDSWFFEHGRAEPLLYRKMTDFLKVLHFQPRKAPYSLFCDRGHTFLVIPVQMVIFGDFCKIFQNDWNGIFELEFLKNCTLLKKSKHRIILGLNWRTLRKSDISDTII